jgi:type VI secretion system protein ImpK
MDKSTTDLVCPILRQGLLVKEDLRRGKQLSFAQEQQRLKSLFQMTTAVNLPNNTFLGVRYPVACWLDELFILDEDSPWKREFEENNIEQALFGRSLGYDLFWDQAKLAEGQSNADALEVFYLCVMLGFRGRLRDDVNQLGNWRDAVETMIGERRQRDWEDKPSELPLPPTNVPPLKAKEQLRWLLLSYAVAVGLAILVGGYAWTNLIRHW